MAKLLFRAHNFKVLMEVEACAISKQLQFFTMNKSDRYIRSDRNTMLFLGIITIQIFQVKSVHLNKYSIPTKPESGSPPVDLLILKNSVDALVEPSTSDEVV